MDFGLGKLTEALAGGKKAEGPALIAALNKPGLAQLVIIAKDGDTTNLKASNLQVGNIIPGVLDAKGTRDTELTSLRFLSQTRGQVVPSPTLL